MDDADSWYLWRESFGDPVAPQASDPVNPNPHSLPNIDVNLLMAFEALLQERSVSRAAQRVGLSQPAMSNALARLRVMLGDPILVRSGRGMVATPRAESLAEPLRDALAGIERVLARAEAFEPATARGVFNLLATDYAAFALLPAFFSRAQTEAPGLDFFVRSLGEEACFSPLDSGEADLALVVGNVSRLPERLYRQVLLSERFKSLVRVGHPAVPGDRIDLDTYVRLSHLLVAPRGTTTGVIDQELDARGLSRRIAMTVPHFLVAPSIVAQSDLVLTVAERVARTFARTYALKVLDPPLPLPGFSTALVWHERTHHEPSHRWLRATFAAVAPLVA